MNTDKAQKLLQDLVYHWQKCTKIAQAGNHDPFELAGYRCLAKRAEEILEEENES